MFMMHLNNFVPFIYEYVAVVTCLSIFYLIQFQSRFSISMNEKLIFPFAILQ
jgi:hypothetical protein